MHGPDLALEHRLAGGTCTRNEEELDAEECSGCSHLGKNAVQMRDPSAGQHLGRRVLMGAHRSVMALNRSSIVDPLLDDDSRLSLLINPGIVLVR